MLLTVPLLNKGSFLGTLINKCRPATVAKFSLRSISKAAKTDEEKVGLPPKPKKPLTAYFRYMTELRPKLRAANPELGLFDAIKQISQQWRTVDNSIKQRLLEEYKNDQKKYIEERAKYDSKITEEQRLKIKELKQERLDAKERRMKRKRVKDLGRPKKPASAFILFICKERTTHPKTSKESFKEWLEKITAKWRKLTDDEKSVYINEARKNLEVYKKQLSLWEEKMLRLGNIDVIRHSNLIDPPEPKPKKH